MYGFVESSESIASQLASPETEQDVFKTRAVLRKALQLTMGGDESHRILVPHTIKLLASSDMVVKKLAVWYVLRHADTEQSVLLAVNTLLKDCSDANPMVRGLALRTLSSFPQSDLAGYAVEPAVEALRDSSAYVRRVAVVGCIKLHMLNPELLSGRGVIDTLYAMIRDPDPLVIANCLAALDEMLMDEGGIVVNRNMARYLLNQLERCTDWGLVTVLRTLHKYVPVEEEEILDIMNIADPFLRHHNSAVVLTCLEYFLLIVTHMPHLRVEVLRRAKPQLLTSLGAGNPELCHELLVYVDSVLEEHGEVFQENYSSFFCKYSEPLTVKLCKMGLLPRLVTPENVEEVLEELGLYCSDLDTTLSKCAIAAVGDVATRHPCHHVACMQRLVTLLHMEIDYVTSHVLQVLQGLNLTDEDDHRMAVLELLPRCLPLVDADGRGALWCLLGNYGHTFDETPYMLETAVKNVMSEHSCDVRLQLLNACMKIFFQRPAEMQDTLGELLDVLGSCADHDTRDRARWYYKLLRTDVGLAESLVLGT